MSAGVVVVILAVVLGLFGLGFVLLIGYAAGHRSNLPVNVSPTSESTTESSGQTDDSADGANQPPPLPDWLPKKTWPEIPAPTDASPEDEKVFSSWTYDYYVPIPRGCPAIEAKPEKDKYQDVAQQLLDCVHEAWQPVFEDEGVEHSKPKIKVFKEKSSGKCGTISAGAPVLYCPDDDTIYIPQSKLGAVDWSGGGPYALVFGQYFHHVQYAVGIVEDAKWSGNNVNEYSRRYELQAQCIGARQVLLTEEAGFDLAVYKKLKNKLASKGDSLSGSSDSQSHWASRGLYAERIGDCNTWTSLGEDVD